MSDHVVLRDSSGALVRWSYAPLHKLGLKEADLEEAIVADPGPLILDDLDLMYHRVVVYSQVRLNTGAGHRSIPDVIALTDHGDIVVIEAKRIANQELHGREVIAQVVDYAATLSQSAEQSLVLAISKGRASTWEELCAEDFGGTNSGRLAGHFRRAVKNADLHLVVACDEAPPALGDWVRAAGNQSALSFALHVSEIRPYVCETRAGEVLWIPVPKVSTEVIHRTSVVVSVEGATSVSVDITTESAEAIDDATAAAKRPRETARKIIGRAADSLGLEGRALWSELSAIHNTALNVQWELGPLAGGDGPETYLRGKSATGNVEGRFGVNLTRRWTPSVFIGAYLIPTDHRQPLLDPRHGDFALILDVWRNSEFDGDGFCADPLFERLRERLRTTGTDWDFGDHLASAHPNRWHPLHLRRALIDVLEGDTPERRQASWFHAAQEALALLLAGGELEALGHKYESHE